MNRKPDAPRRICVEVFRTTFKRIKATMKRLNTTRRSQSLPPLRTYEIVTEACNAWLAVNDNIEQNP